MCRSTVLLAWRGKGNVVFPVEKEGIALESDHGSVGKSNDRSLQALYPHVPSIWNTAIMHQDQYPILGKTEPPVPEVRAFH